MKLANILLVEDCDSDASFFRDFFERQRSCNRITRVVSYQDAWLHVQSGEKFELLVVDIRIRGNGGLELVERIKALSGYDGAPGIVTSGADAEENVREACHLGYWPISSSHSRWRNGGR